MRRLVRRLKREPGPIATAGIADPLVVAARAPRIPEHEARVLAYYREHPDEKGAKFVLRAAARRRRRSDDT
jgi:hypothetical protein